MSIPNALMTREQAAIWAIRTGHAVAHVSWAAGSAVKWTKGELVGSTEDAHFHRYVEGYFSASACWLCQNVTGHPALRKDDDGKYIASPDRFGMYRCNACFRPLSQPTDTH